MVESFENLRKPGRALPGSSHLHRAKRMDVVTARRLLTDKALSTPSVTHLMWIDDDMSFAPDALERLLSWDLPIVGGLCHNRRDPYHPILGKHMDPAWGNGDGVVGFLYDHPPDARVEVDATGGAFLLVKRVVFEAITEKFGYGKWWAPIDDQSEDFSFCERARAAGFKVHVDTGLEVGHLAEVMITSKTGAKLRERQWNKWNPLLDPKDVQKGTPRASIVIPTYNQRPRLLKAAVMSAMSQTVPVEVIVVDDGSETHASVVLGDVINSPHFKLLTHHQNRGIAAALNTGIAAMGTDWFCWLSSDDLFDPRKVELQQASMAQAGAKAGFHGYMSMGVEAGYFGRYAILPDWRTMEEQHRLLSQACLVNGSTTMIHRTALEEAAIAPGVYFDPEFRFGQDWEAWLRIGAKHLWHKTEEILGTRREGGNLTQEIAAEPEGSERRQRRDREDQMIRERYHARMCGHCGKPVAA